MPTLIQTAAQASARGVRARARRNRRLRPVRPSRADELWYKAALLAVTGELKARAQRELLPLLQSLEPLYRPAADSITAHDRASTPGPAAQIIRTRVQALRQQFGIEGAAQRLAQAATARAAQSTDARLADSVRRSIGIDIGGFLTRNTAMQQVMDAATRANIGLIKSLPEQYFDTIAERLTAGIDAGLRYEDLAGQLQSLGDVTDHRAKLIARDQTSKMNGAMTMLRQTSLGISRYVWQTAEDERVRTEHAALDGQEFEWDTPPATGNPGEPVNCRCVAVPVLDLDDSGGDGEDGGDDGSSGLTLGGAVNTGLAAAAIGRYFGEWASAYDGFNPDQPRDEHGKWTEAGGASLSAAAKSVKPGCALVKHPAGSFDAKDVAKATGHQLDGYRAIADTHAMQHTLKKHGTAHEASRGQKQITPDDFGRLPSILSTSEENISAIGKTVIGRDAIGFDKQMDGWNFRAVMEVRTGRKELALVSLYTIGKAKK